MSIYTEGPLPLLFNLDNDPDESYNLINKYPAVGKDLANVISQWEKEMGKNPLGMIQ